MKIKDFLKDYEFAGRKLHLAKFVFKKETVKKFIFNFLKEYGYSDQFNTRDDKEVLICGMCHNRSIDEIFVVTKNYFPRLTVKGFLKTFASVIGDDKNTMVVFYCPDIKKYVVANDWGWELDEDVFCGIYQRDSLRKDDAAFNALKNHLGI